MIKNKGRFAIEVILFAVILFMIYSLATRQETGDMVGDEALKVAADSMSAQEIEAMKKEASALAGSIKTPAQAKKAVKKVNTIAEESNEDVMRHYKKLND